MRCHSCGTEVSEGQKFCMECGASLRGVADITGEVPVIRADRPADTVATDDRTREMTIVAAAPPPPPPPTSTPPPPPPPAASEDTVRMHATAAVAPVAPAPRDDAAPTTPLRLVEATTAPVTITTDPTRTTGELPVGYQPASVAAPTRRAEPSAPPDRHFRLRPLLVLSLLAAGATIVGVLTTVIEIDPAPDTFAPQFTVNDFGTNNAIAALLAAAGMVVGSFAWCFGFRWGAGLAGGAGAALAGWVALLSGIAEWQIAAARADSVATVIERGPGYWALVGAGAMGIVVLLLSLLRLGGDGRSGLDPWVAALGAVSILIAAGGPLIPEGAADWAGNYESQVPGVDLPTAFFVGRAVQLGLLALCGVVGFLLVRRYGLGLAIGGALAAGWLLATAATDQTTSPIGPAHSNPPFDHLEPHAVTIVGFALVGFFGLVAVVMALLDADR